MLLGRCKGWQLDIPCSCQIPEDHRRSKPGADSPHEGQARALGQHVGGGPRQGGGGVHLRVGVHDAHRTVAQDIADHPAERGSKHAAADADDAGQVLADAVLRADHAERPHADGVRPEQYFRTVIAAIPRPQEKSAQCNENANHQILGLFHPEDGAVPDQKITNCATTNGSNGGHNEAAKKIHSCNSGSDATGQCKCHGAHIIHGSQKTGCTQIGIPGHAITVAYLFHGGLSCVCALLQFKYLHLHRPWGTASLTESLHDISGRWAKGCHKMGVHKLAFSVGVKCRHARMTVHKA
mmetsp:Transcript_6957/g.13217  ORF Transcript_6957/g.13217 Transcript_6957/m.13217 type:complete len:295 (-) Transcript_6957:89-973(-)